MSGLLPVAHDAAVFAADVAAGRLLVVGDGHVALSGHPDPRPVAASLHQHRRGRVDVVRVVRVGDWPNSGSTIPNV